MLDETIEPGGGTTSPEPGTAEANGKRKRVGRSDAPFPYVHLRRQSQSRALFSRMARGCCPASSWRVPLGYRPGPAPTRSSLEQAVYSVSPS